MTSFLAITPDLQTFLKEQSLENKVITPLPMDASKRHYYRVEGGQKLIMVCPASEKPDQFFRVSTLLQDHGLRTPTYFSEKDDFYLIEDFGQRTYRHLLSQSNQNSLYHLAVNVLIHLKDAITAQPSFIPTYGRDALLKESMMFSQWFLGLDDDSEDSIDYRDIWQEILDSLNVPQCLILRDYHIDNLFYLDNGSRNPKQADKSSSFADNQNNQNSFIDTSNLKQCGLIDFQDAVWGPVAYDLVSLTEDARIDVPDNLRRLLIDYYLNAFPSSLHLNIRHAAHILDMHRQLRILGVFERLQKRDGKHQYAQYKPRILGYVHRNIRYKTFNVLKKWLEKHHVL